MGQEQSLSLPSPKRNTDFRHGVRLQIYDLSDQNLIFCEECREEVEVEGGPMFSLC